MKLAQQTILITGGTSGIGRELARVLVLRGNVVIITGRDADRLRATLDAFPGLHGFQSDLADSAAIARLYQDVTTRFPKLSVLINNAGIMRNIDLLEPRSLTDLTTEIAIGLSGPIQMAQQFLPHLRAQRDAAIVNVTSGLAFIPMPISPIYCAAKAGLHSYTQSLRAQLAGSTVAVYEIAPPGVETLCFAIHPADGTARTLWRRCLDRAREADRLPQSVSLALASGTSELALETTCEAGCGEGMGGYWAPPP